MQPMLLAGLAGVALFVGLSSFGRDVRMATPLAAQADHLLRTAGFTINEIAVSGHKLALDSDIYAALKLETESSILGYDVVAARRRIEDIAWVAEAQVVRVFPDKLRVLVTERKPVALWRQGEQQALVDSTGRILARVAKGSTPALPVIAGTGAPEAAAELLGALELYPAIARRIETATRVGQRRWSLALSDGTVVHLPEASAREALRRLTELDRRAGLLNRPSQVIDLRRQGLVAIGPQTRRAEAERVPQTRVRHATQAVE
ncbi:MAG: cell division protein FtsQ/DivIB [Hyphomicrobiaceae bacterium]